MAKEIIVDIRSVISTENGTEEISEKSKGSYIEKNGEIYIFCEENVEEAGIVKSRLKVSEDFLELKKQGNSAAIMVFDTAKKTEAVYKTPFGNMNFIVDTKRYEKEISEKGININLKYALLTDNNLVAEYDMDIKIEPTN